MNIGSFIFGLSGLEFFVFAVVELCIFIERKEFVCTVKDDLISVCSKNFEILSNTYITTKKISWYCTLF